MKEISYILKEDEKGTRIVKKETTMNGNDVNTARGSIQVKWLIKNK